MTTPEPRPEEHDREAIEFCLGLLRDDPDMTYREARRLGRTQRGLAVRRQDWTAARREAGLSGRDEDDLFDPPEEKTAPASAATGSPAPSPRSSASGTAAREEGPGRSRTPPWQSDPKRPAPPWATPPARGGDPREEAHPASESPRSPALPSTPRSLFTNPAQNAIEFMVRYLEEKRDAAFEEVREAAEDAGFTIYPATFGRAQAIAGIVEATPKPVIVRTPSNLPATGEARSSAAGEPSSALPGHSRGAYAESSPEAALQIFARAYQNRKRQRNLLRSRIGEMIAVVAAALEER